MDFYKTGMGAKFFNSDLPNLVKQVKRLGDELAKLNIASEPDPEPSFGRFEELSDEDKAELDKLASDFDAWFGQMLKNLEIQGFNMDDIVSIETIKNVSRHAWNANR